MRAYLLAWCVFVGLGIGPAAFAQEKSPSAAPAIQTPASIKIAHWLVGHWHGTGLGGQVDEVWSPAVNGQMIGHFRLVKDGKPVFHEFMILEEHEGGLRLRVKHFNPDMVGWEDKDKSVDFGFVSATTSELTFRGLVLKRESANRLKITLRMRLSDGQTRDEIFNFRKVRH